MGIFYCVESSKESITNVFSYLYKQFFRMSNLWREKANNNNNNNNRN